MFLQWIEIGSTLKVFIEKLFKKILDHHNVISIICGPWECNHGMLWTQSKSKSLDTRFVASYGYILGALKTIVHCLVLLWHYWWCAFECHVDYMIYSNLETKSCIGIRNRIFYIVGTHTNNVSTLQILFVQKGFLNILDYSWFFWSKICGISNIMCTPKLSAYKPRSQSSWSCG